MTDPWLWIRLAAENERMLKPVKDKLLDDLRQSAQEKLDSAWTECCQDQTTPSDE